MSDFFGSVVIVLFFTWPAYVLPLTLGLIILTLFRKDELSRMAGWFTMKPLLATPLWAMILAWGDSANVSEELKAVMGLIPGIGLTLWIVWNYRHLLKTNTGIVILLLIGDSLRWLNAFAWLSDSSLDSPFYAAGLILPNAYALMALVIALLRKRRSLQAAHVGM